VCSNVVSKRALDAEPLSATSGRASPHDFELKSRFGRRRSARELAVLHLLDPKSTI